jgi:ornithine--oxo-acid transaminase
VLFEEKLAERAARWARYLLKRLKAISSPIVTDVRGKGLLIGVELDPKRVSARQFVETLLKHGVSARTRTGRSARFAPPLVVTREELDWGGGAHPRCAEGIRPVYERAA